MNSAQPVIYASDESNEVLSYAANDVIMVLKLSI